MYLSFIFFGLCKKITNSQKLRMAFFGLTALGAQNPFQASKDLVNHLYIFDERDFSPYYKRLANEDGLLELSKLEKLMECVYKGPVAPVEIEYLRKGIVSVSSSGNENVSWSEFVQGLKIAKKLAKDYEAGFLGQLKPACETNSWSEYQSNIRKCKVANRNPSERYITPLTRQQELGWNKVDPSAFQPRKAKRSSEETRFAALMIQYGVY